MGTGVITWWVSSNPIFSGDSDQFGLTSLIEVLTSPPLKYLYLYNCFTQSWYSTYQQVKIPEGFRALQFSFTDNINIPEAFYSLD